MPLKHTVFNLKFPNTYSSKAGPVKSNSTYEERMGLRIAKDKFSPYKTNNAQDQLELIETFIVQSVFAYHHPGCI